jgi:Bcr/CflA subfamily drug resistance transporter
MSMPSTIYRFLVATDIKGVIHNATFSLLINGKAITKPTFPRIILFMLSTSHPYRVTLLVFFATIAPQFSIDLYTPSMPAMQQLFHTNATNIKLTLSLYMLGYGVSQIFFGYLVDKIGRRTTLLISHVGFLVATLLIIFCRSITLLLVWRVLQGCMGGGLQVCLRSTFRDLFRGTQLSKISGIFSSLWAFLPLIAPMFGGYIQHFSGWQMQFQTILLICAFSAFLNWKLLPETRPASANDEKQHFGTALLCHLKNHQLILFASMAGLCGTLIMSYLTLAPFILQNNFQLSPISFGWLILIITFFGMLGSLFTSRFVQRLGEATIIYYSLVACGLSVLTLLLANLFAPHHLASILLPMGLLFFAEGVIYPAVAGMAYESIKQYTGVATAIYGTLLSLLVATGMAVVAIIPHHSMLPFCLFLVVLFVLILIVFTLSRKYLVKSKA